MKSLMPWELDLRSLGAFRIALGLAMLVQIGWRLLNVEWWYGADGFAGQPLRNLLAGFPDLTPFAGGGSLPVALALALSLPLAVMLTLGIQTRLASLTLALVFGMLQIHSPIFLGSELTVMLWSLIWATFLPIDRAFAWRGKPLTETLVSSPAALGLTAQIGFVYTMNGFYKDADAWETGEVLKDLLMGGMYNRPPFSQLLLGLPDWALRAITIAILQLERIALPALLLPSQWVRLLIVLGLMGFHLGSSTVMVVGLYALMSLVWLTALLPPLVWGKASGVLDHWKPGVTALSLGTLVYVVWINIAGFVSGLGAANSIRLESLGLAQNWKNFTSANVTTGVPLFIGEADGVEIDLYRWGVARDGTQVRHKPPSDYNQAYGGKWWNWFAEPQRKVIVNLVESRSPEGFAFPARYLCRKWNDAYPDRTISYIKVKFLSTSQTRELWRGTCASSPFPSHR